MEEFHKTYTALQRDYSSKIQAAIGEPDTTKRQELVSKVLSINSELSNAVRGFLSEIYAGSQAVPTKTMEQLTADMIAYQRQYTLIEKGKDRVETLKLINRFNIVDIINTLINPRMKKKIASVVDKTLICYN